MGFSPERLRTKGNRNCRLYSGKEDSMFHKNVILLFSKCSCENEHVVFHFETESAMSKSIENFLEQALVIMVVYRCAPEKSAAWNSLVQEAANQKATIDLLIYDNSPEPQHFPASPFIKMRYRHNSHNPGISKAYNEACALARGEIEGRAIVVF